MIHWFSEAEFARDIILLTLLESQQNRIKKALKEAEEMIAGFPEIGRVTRLNSNRPDVRELIVEQFRLVYVINHPDGI